MLDLRLGGGLPNRTCTEEYNGTSWTTGCGLIVGRQGLAGAGTQASALAFGGAAPGLLACTEEYTFGVQACTL